VTIGVVLGTGNHYQLDVAASVVLLAFSIRLVVGSEQLARRRRVATGWSAPIDDDGRRLS
jgi:hypothetical protein